MTTNNLSKWMECEAISFNDVQDKSAQQQLLPQCVHQGRGRAQRWGRRVTLCHGNSRRLLYGDGKIGKKVRVS